MPKIHIPVIAYTQGGREMMTTAMGAVDLVRMVAEPQPWDQKASTHGNRPRDAHHVKGIREYLENEQHFVLGAVVLYLTSEEAEFTSVPMPGITTEADVVKPGYLSIDIGSKFDIGDGQHRSNAYDQIVNESDPESEVIHRLKRSGQPLIVVIEDDMKRRAQDFADLQRNVKAPSASMGQSMDRRQPINRELSDLFETSPLFDDRVEYFKDNPGKLSTKLFSFKTVRYVSGLLLVGNGYRSPATMDKAVNARFEGADGGEKARGELTEFWNAIGEMVRFADVVSGEMKAPELREATYLTSAGVLYAIAFAAYTAKKVGIAIPDAIRSLDEVSFDRTAKTSGITAEDTFFAGSLIDPETGKLVAGRTAWETAAKDLMKVVIEKTEWDLVPAQAVGEVDEVSETA
ncbi:DNA sulfur modification protein DndB [Streptomyces sp. SID3212]|uniref:DNA sulfur modification protein DndB n=1 Tax=Streptomyces sp. SID3212 TaxID=2690259 RepID=UPI00136CCEFD|nr:DNA sulfur modification protein DndB [Streptomyces sp. SID3212]MYV57667.1 DGQHR domain-containing protein [Streptomyces sp. SID3212]